jgi:hypothetical protein
MIVDFLLTFIGAVAFWLVKGMKTDLDSEMSRRMDKDFKYYRNLATGFLIVLLFLALIYSIV